MRRTSRADLRPLFDELLDNLDGEDRYDLFARALEALVAMAKLKTATLDMKITSNVLTEMAGAFAIFKPYADMPKVTFFGSSRTQPNDALYTQATLLASRMSELGWMTVTGAGPGIMQAAMEGAGQDKSLGVNIRLPHEQGANPFIAHDPKLVEMRYFFIRKLMLVKESDAYVVLPGGFGTLDECFELFTLLQTGKMPPAPLILLDVPGDPYWPKWDGLVRDLLVPRGLVSPEDVVLYHLSTDIDEAVAEILHFYSNYHSMRFVGDMLVIRTMKPVEDTALDNLNTRFADITSDGSIRRTGPYSPEKAESDHLDLHRIALRFNKASFSRLRVLIDALNGTR